MLERVNDSMCSVNLEDGTRETGSNPSKLPLKDAVEDSYQV